MKSLSILIFTIVSFSLSHCIQYKNSQMENNNPLLCKPELGICEIAPSTENTSNSRIQAAIKKNIKVIYYTDPICSSCWGIEPEIRKLKLEYGDQIEFDYRMGGLLPDWSYNSGGISKPSDVAHHWDEMSEYYDMPIDGDVWLEDPLHSSYPPSIAFKAAQLQDLEKASLFLRALREKVFIHKQNICRWEHIESAALEAKLDIQQLKNDIDNKAKSLFNEDLNLGRDLGVRGFPTMFFVDTSGNREIVYGSKPYSAYVNALSKLDKNIKKYVYAKDWKSIFNHYHSLTAKEYSVIAELPRNDAETKLNELTSNGLLKRKVTKNGAIWTLN